MDGVLGEAMYRRPNLRSPRFWVAVALCVVFLGLGLRTFLNPASASAYYGLALAPGDLGTAFVQAYGARNIGLSLIAAALVAMGMRRGFAALLIGAAGIAVLDFVIVAGRTDAANAAKHLAYVVVLSALGAWFFRNAGDQAASDRIAGF